nr:uncharacterized protein LOC103434567 [Malus domestica]
MQGLHHQQQQLTAFLSVAIPKDDSALAWVDSAHKIRSRVDKIDGENPTWNDRFLFKVPSTPSAASAITVGIVRLLINNFLDVASKVPLAASARPSGRFQGVLNVAAMVIDGSYLAPAVSELSAVGYRDLMGNGESFRCRRRDSMKSKSSDYPGNSKENSFTESAENSDVCESAASSLATPLPPLKEVNMITELAGTTRQVLKARPMDGSRFLCCLLTQRKMQYCPSDENADGAHSRERRCQRSGCHKGAEELDGV